MSVWMRRLTKPLRWHVFCFLRAALKINLEGVGRDSEILKNAFSRDFHSFLRPRITKYPSWMVCFAATGLLEITWNYQWIHVNPTLRYKNGAEAWRVHAWHAQSILKLRQTLTSLPQPIRVCRPRCSIGRTWSATIPIVLDYRQANLPNWSYPHSWQLLYQADRVARSLELPEEEIDAWSSWLTMIYSTWDPDPALIFFPLGDSSITSPDSSVALGLSFFRFFLASSLAIPPPATDATSVAVSTPAATLVPAEAVTRRAASQFSSQIHLKIVLKQFDDIV